MALEMKKSAYLVAAFVVALSVVSGSAHAANGIIEPDFTTADPDKAGSLKAAVSKPGPGPEKEGKSRTFTVEPEGFSALKNDTDFDISDLHMTILDKDFEWDDANGDGKIFSGKDNFYLRDVTVSKDKKTIWLQKGLIPKGKAFDPLFDVKNFPEGGVSINGYFTVPVPEPSTLLLLGSALTGWLGFAGLRRVIGGTKGKG